ncbi:hypothetical protein [Arachidicoccus soli]|uniref:PKD domain-containing protein n=1 Tax=Arachidicoccus soli TaxID=2341117 RepID=A0A386HMC7_9BACT|nr:hypothetical protein [Arachidicoccus soli]AYD46832.1 hypothetical protein D6B99_03905 [Arachidicoccus soli]
MNKRNFKIIISFGVIVSAASLFFSSCQKKNPSLGAFPSASFTSAAITPTSDSTAWNLELINTTSTPSIAYWNIPGIGRYKGDTVKVVIQNAGNYAVQLTVAGQGGTDSVSQTINVAQDNPYTVKASFKSQMLTPSSFANPQNLELISTSLFSKSASWTVTGSDGGSIGTFTGDTVKVTIPNAGAYTVKLTATGNGGLTSMATQVVNIAQDNPYGLDPNGIFGILDGSGIGLTQRTWIPNRVVASCVVWDSYADVLSVVNGGGGAWWAFGAAEIADSTGRDGYLDDKYTFTTGKSMIYNDNNTVYLDGGHSPWTASGTLPAPWSDYQGTYASTRDSAIGSSSQEIASTSTPTPISTALYNVVPALKPWGSGTFTYSISASGGAMGLGTVTVYGVGAHIGLSDKSNTVEQKTPTLQSATYDVLKISTNQVDAGGTYDEIVFGIFVANINNYWGFRLKSYR